MEKFLTGGQSRYCKTLSLALLLVSGLWSAQTFATEVGLAGILGSKAMLTIDGSAPRTLAVGQSYNGVKLLSVQGDSVQVEINGNRRSLRIGQNAVGVASSASENARATLTADVRGHFQTTGSINGLPVRFLVDTGASLVSMSASDAKHLGLDLSRAKTGMAMTANGVVKTYEVTLNTVKVGGITLHNVAASVSSQDMPYLLLGMSFLNRTKMERNGDTMTLTQQYR
ncbi:MAG: TIGR02281 family clan AA aspartic protease [Zoogloeaceae bacterium]|nr:TIGR02281 family clan AA aspartic protease [Zoogloeaceae bacterium]